MSRFKSGSVLSASSLRLACPALRSSSWWAPRCILTLHGSVYKDHFCVFYNNNSCVLEC